LVFAEASASFVVVGSFGLADLMFKEAFNLVVVGRHLKPGNPCACCGGRLLAGGAGRPRAIVAAAPTRCPFN
jgi:hypothetical protein